jgi:alanyl-tRNA synthetase
LVNLDDPDVLEIWNNVFMQFNREPDGSLTNLPMGSVDTGMGLERVASIMMNKRSNYDTDLFQGIFAAIQKATGCRDYTGKIGDEDTDHVDMAYRVIADHIRNLTIALTDGAIPSSEGRGYVLRRILRRAVRYGRDILKAPAGFFHPLVDSVVETLGEAYPEIKERPQDVKEILKAEEEQFGRTLDKGITQFSKCAKKGSITAEDAFMLSGSYGFPIDLTELMAEEKGITVDVKGYEEKMANSKAESRGAGNFKGRKDMQLMAAQTDALQKAMSVPVTDESNKYIWDSTGEGEEYTTKVMAIYNGKDFVDSATSGSDSFGLVLEHTPCYAEQGGQIYDTATITGSGAEFQADDVQKYAGYVLHIGTVKSGSIKKGDSVKIKVDYNRRALVAKNHTATHILNFALREVLGEKIDQKGSLVDESKLRFDFAHSKPIERDELAKIEEIVNREIQKAHLVKFKEVPLDAAMKIGGLRAVFGEKYPDPVRVLSVGKDVDTMIADTSQPWGRQVSVEFCGGTHVACSDEIFRFVLQVEEGIAKGVRRIVGVTGPQACGDAALRVKTLTVKFDKTAALKGAELDKMIAEMRGDITQDKDISLVEKKDMIVKLEQISEGQKSAGKAGKKEAEKKAKEAGEKLAADASKADKMFVSVVDVGGGDDAKVLSVAMDALIKKCTDKAIFLLSNSGGKLALLAAVPASLQGGMSAKAWTDSVLAVIGGKGGGKEDRAQGQVADPTLLDKALAAANAFVPTGGAAPKKASSPKAEPKKGKDKGGDKKEDKPADPEADRKALLKKVIKEGGKRGVEIEGAADMGGLQFFCTSVEFPDGDTDLLIKCMEAMNEKSDPTEEERKGGSGAIGKMIFSAGTEQLAIAAYVPEGKQGELSCEEWLNKVLALYPSKVVSVAKDVCVGVIPTDGDKNIFPLKIRESLILEANNFLRSKGLFPEDKDSDDDEFVFGDDDFPSM